MFLSVEVVVIVEICFLTFACCYDTTVSLTPLKRRRLHK